MLPAHPAIARTAIGSNPHRPQSSAILVYSPARRALLLESHRSSTKFCAGVQLGRARTRWEGLFQVGWSAYNSSSMCGTRKIMIVSLQVYSVLSRTPVSSSTITPTRTSSSRNLSLTSVPLSGPDRQLKRALHLHGWHLTNWWIISFHLLFRQPRFGAVPKANLRRFILHTPNYLAAATGPSSVIRKLLIRVSSASGGSLPLFGIRGSHQRGLQI